MRLSDDKKHEAILNLNRVLFVTLTDLVSGGRGHEDAMLCIVVMSIMGADGGEEEGGGAASTALPETCDGRLGLGQA